LLNILYLLEFCHILAEGKPPLFNMNAMAALYHIPQNEAPTLADPNWSAEFNSFVQTCLTKSPEDRPGAAVAMMVSHSALALLLSAMSALCAVSCVITLLDVLQHTFITMHAARSYDIIRDLITRTKAVVREMDKRNARKIKKFLMEEYTEDSGSLTESNGSLPHTDSISLPDESSQVYGLSFTHKYQIVAALPSPQYFNA